MMHTRTFSRSPMNQLNPDRSTLSSHTAAQWDPTFKELLDVNIGMSIEVNGALAQAKHVKPVNA